MSENNRPDLRVFSVRSFESDEKKDRWTQIGGAWKNQSGGYNIQLGDKIILLPPMEDSE